MGMKGKIIGVGQGDSGEIVQSNNQVSFLDMLKKKLKIA